MAQKNANIKVTADTKDATTKLKKLNGQLNAMDKNDSLQKNYKEGQKALKNLSASSNVYVAIIMAAIAALKKGFEVMRETSAAYNEHADIIKRLDIVAGQSPYINGQSVRNLQKYAKELEKTTAYSKNAILQNISELAGTGKTEEQIMKIMGAAADYAAAKNIDLNTAVNQLNATYSGTIGQLGKQDKAFKALTKDQLANGAAIDIVIKKYGGVAKEVANTSTQLKNAQTTAKEQMGSVLTETNDAFNKAGIKASEKFSEGFVSFFKNYFRAWLDGEAPKLMSAFFATTGGLPGIAQAISLAITESKSGLKGFNRTASTMSDAELSAYVGNITSSMSYDGNLGLRDHELVLEKKEKSKKITEAERKLLQQIRFEIQNRYRIEQALDQQRKIELKEEERLLEIEEQKKERQRLANEYALNIIEPIEKQFQTRMRQINAEENELKTLSSEEAEWERLGAYAERYEAAAKNAQDNTNFTFKNPTFLKWKQEYEEFVKEMGMTPEDFKALEKSFTDVGKTAKKETIDSLKENLKFLDSYADKIKDGTELEKQWIEARKELNKQIADEEVRIQQEKFNKIMDVSMDFIDRYSEITETITEMLTTQNEEQTEQALGMLSEQYTDGIISYEDYCDQKAEIARQSAREQYKIDMFSWSASLLQATANIAQGISKAIAEGGVLGIITGALVAAAGATQIASIVASKPKPPAFASGGIVGATMGGDNAIATVRTGEMILNAQQQKKLWQMMNGQGGMGLNVTINNTASDKVQATAQMGQNGLTVIVSDIVNTQMQKGTYTNSMNIANARANGVSFL